MSLKEEDRKIIQKFSLQNLLLQAIVKSIEYLL